jgi:hypothetical protein
MERCCDASVVQPRSALYQLFIRIKKIVTGGLNIVALRRWIKLKARRRFRKALGAPQSAKIHRPKIKNSHSGNRQNRAERRLHVTHQVKNRTQYLLSYEVKPLGWGVHNSFSMDSIAIASQRDWTLTQLAPHQNSSVDLLRSSNTFCRRD